MSKGWMPFELLHVKFRDCIAAFNIKRTNHPILCSLDDNTIELLGVIDGSILRLTSNGDTEELLRFFIDRNHPFTIQIDVPTSCTIGIDIVEGLMSCNKWRLIAFSQVTVYSTFAMP